MHNNFVLSSGTFFLIQSPDVRNQQFSTGAGSFLNIFSTKKWSEKVSRVVVANSRVSWNSVRVDGGYLRAQLPCRALDHVVLGKKILQKYQQ